MKKLLSLIGLLAILGASNLQAQQTMTLTSLAANTVSNVVAFPCIVDNFQIINSTTNIATVRFYDAATAVTNFTQGAYNNYTTYATNFSVIFTNQTGVLVTNTFAGTYTGASSAGTAGSITRPTMFIAVVPPSSVLNKDVKLQSVRGLTVHPDQTLTLITTYRQQY